MKLQTDASDTIVEATIAELAFLFVFSIVVSYTITQLNTTVAQDTVEKLDAAIQEIRLRKTCDCDMEVVRLGEDGREVSVRVSCSGEHYDDSMFTPAKASLTPMGERCLDALCPTVVTEVWRADDRRLAVTIEGHASSEWNTKLKTEFNGLACLSKRHCNQALSSQRSMTVYDYCQKSIDPGGLLAPQGVTKAYREANPAGSLESWYAFYEQRFKNEGLGSRSVIRNGDGEENRKASRRVEFRLSRTFSPRH